MKFAVATYDEKSLRFGHFGDAKKFLIYEYREWKNLKIDLKSLKIRI